MSVPKKRISKRRTRARRSHHSIQSPTVSTCPKCSAALQPHHACPSCGYYKGRDVLNKTATAEKKLKKQVAKTAPAAKATPKKEEKKSE